MTSASGEAAGEKCFGGSIPAELGPHTLGEILLPAWDLFGLCHSFRY